MKLPGILLVSGAAALTSAACSRDEIINVDSDKAPGTSQPTIEALLNTSAIETWTDTVFSGFSGPANATFTLVQEGPDLFSHGLYRWTTIVDSVFSVDTFTAVIRYDSARVTVPLDSARTVPASDSTTVQLRAVLEDWDLGSANWNFAIDTVGEQVAWTVPGGTLGGVIAEQKFGEGATEVIFQLGALTDSLLRAWADTSQPNLGLAVTLADSGVFYGLLPRLDYQAVGEAEPDTFVEIGASVSQRTFIFDPPMTLPPPEVLQLGGIVGFRIYTELILPDSLLVTGGLGTISLGGAQINRAELELRSLAPPPAPFGAQNAFGALANRIGGDFKVLGPKTPLSEIIPLSDVIIDPDSLSAGSIVRFNLTERLQQLADSLDRFGTTISPTLRIAVRPFPAAAGFGFWQFGSAAGDTAFAPIVRIIFTPSIDFGLPNDRTR